MKINYPDPYDRLNDLETAVELLAKELQRLSELSRQQSYLLENISNFFKPVAYRLDQNLKEIKELQRRIEYLEAIND